MPTILVLLVAASQVLYEAKVSTFGCNSGALVAELQSIRSDEKTFQGILYQKMVEGDCVVFPAGSVVEGSADTTDTSMLRVQAQLDPPGYIAPSDDFKLKEAVGEK
jgi:hypothetical protein